MIIVIRCPSYKHPVIPLLNPSTEELARFKEDEIVHLRGRGVPKGILEYVQGLEGKALQERYSYAMHAKECARLSRMQ